MEKQIVGHVFLAKLGKKRLRPGGKDATNFLLSYVNFENKNVLDVACNMATTSIEIAKKYKCHIEAIDLDEKALVKAKASAEKNNVQNQITFKVANAAELPYANDTFDIVINEAMLTMQHSLIKQKCLKEYFRVLKPGGILLTQDISLVGNNPNIKEQLSKAINIKVEPLKTNEWLDFFKQSGFNILDSLQGKMSLLNPIGLIKDEGLVNTIKIIKNAIKKVNRPMFKNLYTFFRKNHHDLNYIAIVSQKPY